MGHYASDMGYERRKLASWFDLKLNPKTDQHERMFPYVTAGKDLVSHEPCGGVFKFDIWSEDDTTRAYKHHYDCPAIYGRGPKLYA